MIQTLLLFLGIVIMYIVGYTLGGITVRAYYALMERVRAVK